MRRISALSSQTEVSMAKRPTIIDTSVPDFVSPPLRIICARAGFRRGGIVHPAGATDYPAGEFTVDQIRLFEDEPALEVAPITGKLSEVLTPAEDAEKSGE